MVRAYEARGGAGQLTELNRFLTGLSWNLSLVEALRRQRAALLERFASCRKSWMRSEASEVPPGPSSVSYTHLTLPTIE